MAEPINSEDKMSLTEFPKTEKQKVRKNRKTKSSEKQKIEKTEEREDCCGEAQPRELREISEGRVNLED